MSKISTYDVAPVPKLADKLIGTSVGGTPDDGTYNFTLQELLTLFLPNIPANNLQGVLDYGNTAIQDINLTGTIYTTDLDVSSIATILDSFLTGDTHITGGLFDVNTSIGTAGQVLTSTGFNVEWYTIPTVIPDLQQVLTAGNTANVDILLNADIQALDVSSDTATFSTDLTIDGTLTDGTASVGTAGKVLSSTGTGVQWVSLPVYSATSPLFFDSNTGVFSIQVANGTQDGYLTSADWITFNGKQNAGNYITALTGEATATGPGSVAITLSNTAVIGKILTGLLITGGTITSTDTILQAFGKAQNQINGKQDTITLTTTGTSGAATLIGATLNIPNYADTYVGTVTSVSFTLGASGTDLNSSVTNSTTTPAITLNVPTASASARGALSAADWTTFNSKQAAGNYITSLTGEATASGPGAAAITLTNSAVIAKVLTGLNVTGGTVIAADTILAAFGKVQNQINGLIGGSIFQGVWNASTNTPALVSSVGTNGYYYIVSVAGSTNLDGITDWQVGDWAIFAGTSWQKVDNTDAVSSVNGFTGAVSLTTDNVPEGATNLYFTNTRARTAISLTTTGSSGASTYDNTTGVFNIPTYTDAYVGTVTSVGLSSATSGVTIGSTPVTTSGTITIAIATATASQNGLLSSTDWITFNSKQNALTNPVTGTGTTNTLPKFTGASTIGDSAITDDGTTVTLVSRALSGTSASFSSSATATAFIPTSATIPTNGMYLGAANTLSFATNSGNRMSIGATGSVTMVSTLALGNYLQIQNANTFIYGGTTVGSIQYGNSTSSTHIKTYGATHATLANTLELTTASVARLTISSTGLATFSGAVSITGQLTLGSTITNGTYTYTLPSATGTLALVGGAGVGTVTSVAAITLGTTGTDLSSTVANGTTTPVITLQVPTASAANRGALSAADWTTFNGKQATITLTTTGTSGAATFIANTLNIPQYQASGTYVTSVTGTSPIVSSGGTTPAISIPVATTSVNGYLSSTDWTTFNNKQATITLTTTGTSGAATLVGSTLNVPNYADGGVLSLSAIGATANANGATITGTVLNLQPADASFGGVVTTGTQTFAGAKTFSSQLTLSSTLSNGTYTYTLPSATGTLALTSALSSYLPLSGGTLTGPLSGTSATFSQGISADVGSATSSIQVRNASTDAPFIGFYRGGTLRNTLQLLTDGSFKLTDASLVANAGLTMGALSGTSATFSSTVTVSNADPLTYLQLANTSSGGQTYTLISAGVSNPHSEAVGTFYIRNSSTSTTPFRIASTGAATFSSSVALGQTISTVATNGILYHSTNNNLYIQGGSAGVAMYSDGGRSNASIVMDSATQALYFGTVSTTRLTIASTGAATFSSSVTAAGATFSGTTAVASAAGTSQMRIDRSGTVARIQNYDTGQAANISLAYDGGNVGIGTTSPANLLSLKATTTAPILDIARSGGGQGKNSGILFRDQSNNEIGAIGTEGQVTNDLQILSTGGIRLNTSSDLISTNERMRIASGGNVLIGTTTDNGYRLQVVGSGIVASFNDTSSGDENIRFLANGTFRGGLGADANYALKITGVGATQVAVINTSTGVYTATSDRILKKNISDSPLALPVLNQIKIRQYNWKSDDSVEQYGVIAQELYEVAPTYVSKPKKETDKWGVSKAELVPLLIKAIQEQQKQIEELKSLIN